MPTLFLLAFASGVAAALASRRELRLSPRPAVLTLGFGALALFLCLVLVPVSVYFFVFHGDWALHYLVDVASVPSAVALVGFMLEVALGAGGFAVGAALVRGQREPIAAALLAGVVLVGAAALVVARERLAVVGTWAQFHGGFGLAPFGVGTMVYETVVMAVFVVLGLGYLIARVTTGGRRGV